VQQGSIMFSQPTCEYIKHRIYTSVIVISVLHVCYYFVDRLHPRHVSVPNYGHFHFIN
jgi:hypothetical protein